MNEKQQTAVQWLIEQMAEHFFEIADGKISFAELRNKALEMEREQIEMAYKADLYPCSDEDAQQYFTDTYQTEP